MGDAEFEERKKAKLARQPKVVPPEVDQPKYEPWDRKTRNYQRSFMLKLARTNYCVESLSKVPEKGASLVLRTCNVRHGKHQVSPTSARQKSPHRHFQNLNSFLTAKTAL